MIHTLYVLIAETGQGSVSVRAFIDKTAKQHLMSSRFGGRGTLKSYMKAQSPGTVQRLDARSGDDCKRMDRDNYIKSHV